MKIAVLLIAVVTAFGSCKKGDKGDTGPSGTSGTNGTNGTNGNANVIGTNTVTTSASSWTWGSPFYTTVITAAGITQDIVDKGIVEVFIQYGIGWSNLPDINGKNSTTFVFSLGQVKLYNSNSDLTQPVNPGAQVFRLVIISASNRLAHQHTNWSNYNEVKQVLNLKD